jgi:anti-sigma factor (TIGR02949 family)
MNMTLIKFGEQACQKALARLDSYIDDELLTESNLELHDHFQRCPSCTQEEEARRAVRTRLRTAVREVAIPAGLEGRVRERLRQQRQSQPGRVNFMALAATLAVCCGSWIAYQLGTLRLTNAAQESDFALISNQAAGILRVGLGDHLHCSVLRKRALRSQGPADKLPERLKELGPLVQSNVPADLPLILAHECRFGGRQFVHLTFGNDLNLLSLIVARKRPGESLRNSTLPAKLSQAGIPVYTAGVQQYQVAAMEDSSFLMFTISDLPQQKNLSVLMALAPSLQNLLQRMGA